MRKKVVTIKNWYIIAGHLYGEIYGHRRIADGTEIKSKTIESRYNYEGDEYVETSFLVYKLGKKRVPTREERQII